MVEAGVVLFSLVPGGLQGAFTLLSKVIQEAREIISLAFDEIYLK